MKSILTKARGFTLVELMISISIIAILSFGGISVFTAYLQGSRDSTRISDIKSIEKAANTWYTVNFAYPAATAPNSITGAIDLYLTKDIFDTKSGENCNGTYSGGEDSTCDYTYVRGDNAEGAENQAFEASTAFESTSSINGEATEDNGSDDLRLEVGTRIAALNTEMSGSGGTLVDGTGVIINAAAY